MQPATVDDAYAPMVLVLAGDQELLDRGRRFRGFHPVQIPPLGRDVIAPLQFSDLAPIHARRDEVRDIVTLVRHVGSRARRRRLGM